MSSLTPDRVRTRTTARAERRSSKVDRFSLIDLELAARGVAEVVVFLKKRPAAAAGAAVAAPRHTAYAESASNVMTCFDDGPASHNAALRQAQTFGAPVGAASARLHVKSNADAPARLFRNLGVMLGTVSRDGLDALSAHDDVTKVMPAAQLRLIRPRRVAAAATPKQPTWGIRTLGIKKLWDKGFQGQGVLVGHLDTGVDGKHLALKDALEEFVKINDFGEIDAAVTAATDSGEHGTHTAGTIAGRPVGKSIIGVAPESKLASAMVIEGGNVVARVLGGLDWAIDQKVRIVSMSLGFAGFHNFFSDVFVALREAEILPVIAVGNEEAGTSRSPGNYAESLSVGAIDKTLAVAKFSSSQRFVREDDPLVPDVVAPGVAIISAKPGGDYQSMDGTSMATPHVAGLAAA